MKNTHAFVVGVSRYFSASWNTDGPVHNAMSIAEWLLSNGTPAGNVHLFIDASVLTDNERGTLAKKRITPFATTHAAINQFWRETLPSILQPGDCLFFYWSGHGMTDSGNRLFFCGDYSTKMTASVFNMTEFLANLRSAAFRPLQSQLLFADVCGTFARAKTAPTNSRPDELPKVDQLAVFATAEGEFTPMTDLSGAFTDALLEVLAPFEKRWPSQAELLSELDKVSERSSLKPFILDLKGNLVEKRRRFGTGQRARQEYANSAYAMLSRHSTESIQRRHFERTLVGLGHDPGSKRRTLLEMIDELSDVMDARDSVAPYGLVEFLARLEADPSFDKTGKQDIADWIARHGADRRREINERLQNERANRLLLLEVKHVDGQLSELVTYLRYPDLTPVAGVKEERFPITNWDQLCDSVRARVDDPTVLPPEGDLELHFLTDAPLFHLPFHKILSADGSPIGEHFVCVLHSLRRARLPEGSQELERWRDWQESLAIDMTFQQLLDPPWPSEGLYYLNRPIGLALPSEMAKRRLQKLIQLGAPLMCWPHNEDSALDLISILQTMVMDAEVFSGLPGTLLTRRLSECPVASDVSMLYDERLFRPFVKTQGT
jgi:hypothetical protein